MNRDSLLYKFRRKIQVIAHKLFSDETMSKFYYKIVLNNNLDFNNPQTFNEKLQWLKLYYYPHNPLVIQCADKFAVRKYITKMGYEDKLVPLVNSWYSAKEIQWEALPEKFVLKCNHGCAYNIICDDKSSFDKVKATKQINKWMKEDFGAFNIEPHYSRILPKIITCEEYLGDNITDYKFFCFNGIPKFIYVSRDLIHDRQACIGFFNMDGSKLPLTRNDYADISSVEFPLFFNEMKNMAINLSKEFPFVRVDFFLANGTYYFAELTFTPSACMMPFNPQKYDLEWGNKLNINEAMRGKNSI